MTEKIIIKITEEELETIKEALWLAKIRREREAYSMSKSEYSLYTPEQIEEVKNEAKQYKKTYNKLAFINKEEN